MHFEFIEMFLANDVQNIKWVNVLENLCPGSLENVIIRKDPCRFDKDVGMRHCVILYMTRLPGAVPQQLF